MRPGLLRFVSCRIARAGGAPQLSSSNPFFQAGLAEIVPARHEPRRLAPGAMMSSSRAGGLVPGRSAGEP
jgi:hypothetical protein